jgi:hypothetical protein
MRRPLSSPNHALTLNLECLVFSFSLSDELVDGRDFGLGGGDAGRGAGDSERLDPVIDRSSRTGEDGIDVVGNGVLPFTPGGGELGGA